MDMVAMLRGLGALALVLGLLVAAVPLLRRFAARLPGTAPGAPRRMAIIERLALDAGTRRQLLLVEVDGRRHLLLLSPDGVAIGDAQPRKAE